MQGLKELGGQISSFEALKFIEGKGSIVLCFRPLVIIYPFCAGCFVVGVSKSEESFGADVVVLFSVISLDVFVLRFPIGVFAFSALL